MMKITLMAVMAALAFTGVAQAGAFQAGDLIISETLTGYVVGGNDSGANGTNDDAKLFGGGDLLNAAVTLTFSYDVTYLKADPSTISYNDGIGRSEIGAYNDTAGYNFSVTIGNYSFSVAPSYLDETYLDDSDDGQGANANFGGTHSIDLANDFLDLYSQNSGGSNPPYDVTIASDITEWLTKPDDFNELQAGNDTIGSQCGCFTGVFDTLYLSPLSTPEPSTLLSLAAGLGGLGLVRFRRNADTR